MIHTQVANTHQPIFFYSIIGVSFFFSPLEETELIFVYPSLALSFCSGRGERQAQLNSLKVWRQLKNRFIPQLRGNDNVSFVPQMSAVWMISHSTCRCSQNKTLLLSLLRSASFTDFSDFFPLLLSCCKFAQPNQETSRAGGVS